MCGLRVWLNHTHIRASSQVLAIYSLPAYCSLRFGGILLHADRFKHINNVARILLQDSRVGQMVILFLITVPHNNCYIKLLFFVFHFHFSANSVLSFSVSWRIKNGRSWREAATVTPLCFQGSSPVCINVLFILHSVVFSTKKRQLQQRRERRSKENLKDITDSSVCLFLTSNYIPWTEWTCMFAPSFCLSI